MPAYRSSLACSHVLGHPPGLGVVKDLHLRSSVTTHAQSEVAYTLGRPSSFPSPGDAGNYRMPVEASLRTLSPLTKLHWLLLTAV